MKRPSRSRANIDRKRTVRASSPTVESSATPRGSRKSAGASEWIAAGASGIHGRGIYARRDIPDGTRIIEYVGERITKAEAFRREARRIAQQAKGGDGCVTIFDLNQRYDLDGRSARNVARFINHSCAPNCRAENIRGRIWILARRDIAAGEELTFDYGYGLKNWFQHPCRCGARGCVGYIVGAAQRWRVRRFLRRSRGRLPSD